MIISIEKPRKVRKKGKYHLSILQCWVNKRLEVECSRMMSLNVRFVQFRKKTWDCPAMLLNDVSVEDVKMFCYLGGLVGAGGDAGNNALRIRNGWTKFRNLFLSNS